MNLGGSFSTVASATSPLTHDPALWYELILDMSDTTLRGILRESGSTSDDWDVEAFNQTDHPAGGTGLRSFINTGNTNVDPTAKYTYFALSTAAQWTAISTADRVLVGGRGSSIRAITGRSTELSDINPSEMSLVLDDRDGRYTPGNTRSPLHPDWKAGVPIRFSETVGARTFRFPDLALEISEVELSFESSADPTFTDRTLAVRCVDLLTRLNRAPAFASNLAAYIVGEARPGALRGYWPLTDPAGSTYATAAGPVSQDPLRFSQVASYSPVPFTDTLLNFGNQDGPPGDDGPAVEFTTTAGTWGRLANSELKGMQTNPAPSASNPDVATLLTWVYVPSGVTALDQLVLWREFETFALYILVDGYASSGGTTWRVDFQTEGGNSSAVGSSGIVTGWHLLGAQLEFNLGDFALWVDGGDPVTGSIGLGGTFGGFPLDRIVLDGSESSAPGVRMAHVQCYIGDADAFTHEDHLAQYQFGKNGFGQQRVDQRIRAICNYAGIGDGQLDLEESDSLIQPAAFAGQRPGDLASAAARTGGGILFTRGSELVYQDRKHRFNL